MQKTSLLIVVIVVILGGGLVANDGLFVVPVDRFVIVTEFGAPIRVIEEPGLYFKVPAIQHVVSIDKRIMSWDDQPQEVITRDKKRIYINSFARWRVEDALKYYTAVRDESVAQMNLDKIIGGNIREIVSGNLLDTLVRDTDRVLTYATEDSERERATAELPDGQGRTAIVNAIVSLSKTELKETFGIAIIDVDIKQLNYTKSAQDATIRQMISEREKVAATYEAQGRKEADTIAGETQEQVLGLRGSATRERLRIEGESRAEASATKAVAFGQDPEFFRFIQSLELYQAAFQTNTSLYLSTESPLLELLLFSERAGADETAQQDLKALMESLDTGALDEAFGGQPIPTASSIANDAKVEKAANDAKAEEAEKAEKAEDAGVPTPAQKAQDGAEEVPAP